MSDVLSREEYRRNLTHGGCSKWHRDIAMRSDEALRKQVEELEADVERHLTMDRREKEHLRAEVERLQGEVKSFELAAKLEGRTYEHLVELEAQVERLTKKLDAP